MSRIYSVFIAFLLAFWSFYLIRVSSSVSSSTPEPPSSGAYVSSSESSEPSSQSSGKPNNIKFGKVYANTLDIPYVFHFKDNKGEGYIKIIQGSFKLDKRKDAPYIDNYCIEISCLKPILFYTKTQDENGIFNYESASRNDYMTYHATIMKELPDVIDDNSPPYIFLFKDGFTITLPEHVLTLYEFEYLVLFYDASDGKWIAEENDGISRMTLRAEPSKNGIPSNYFSFSRQIYSEFYYTVVFTKVLI